MGSSKPAVTQRIVRFAIGAVFCSPHIRRRALLAPRIAENDLLKKTCEIYAARNTPPKQDTAESDQLK